jgi:hypothetical protein
MVPRLPRLPSRDFTFHFSPNHPKTQPYIETQGAKYGNTLYRIVDIASAEIRGFQASILHAERQLRLPAPKVLDPLIDRVPSFTSQLGRV